MPEAGFCLCLPLPGSPGPCGAQFACRVLPVPVGVQSCGRGLVLAAQPLGVLVHIPAPGQQLFLVRLCSSPPGWAARWDVAGPGNPWSCPEQGGLGYPLHLWGLVVPSAAPIGWAVVVPPGQAQQRRRRGVWAMVWWPTGAGGCNVPPGFPLEALPGGLGAWQPGRAAAGGRRWLREAAPHLPAHCRFLPGR